MSPDPDQVETKEEEVTETTPPPPRRTPSTARPRSRPRLPRRRPRKRRRRRRQLRLRRSRQRSQPRRKKLKRALQNPVRSIYTQYPHFHTPQKTKHTSPKQTSTKITNQMAKKQRYQQRSLYITHISQLSKEPFLVRRTSFNAI